VTGDEGHAKQGAESEEQGVSKFLTALFFSSVLLALCPLLLAGDAVAIGYNADGIWTSVTYYSSGKPKGSSDYKTERDARDEALRDLRKRGGESLVRSEIISSSDSTGYVAVARGTDKSHKDQNVAGRGKTPTEAEQNAIAELNKAGASKGQKVVYRYFSHGEDGK
jgi:hypothetical protein